MARKKKRAGRSIAGLPQTDGFKRTLAEMWAEMEAGKVTVCFPEGETESCILWIKDRIILLDRVPEEQCPTFEFKPEDYTPPTKADIQRVMKKSQ